MDQAWRSSVSRSRRTSSVTGLGLGIQALYRKSLAQGACAILLRTLVALQIEHAAVRLGGRPIWTAVDLEVQEGEFVAILGPNGAGKSTLLKALLGLGPLAGGSARVFGRPVRRGSDEIRYLPQPRRSDPNIRISSGYRVRLGRAG